MFVCPTEWVVRELLAELAADVARIALLLSAPGLHPSRVHDGRYGERPDGRSDCFFIGVDPKGIAVDIVTELRLSLLEQRLFGEGGFIVGDPSPGLNGNAGDPGTA